MNRHRIMSVTGAILAVCMLALPACETSPETEKERQTLHDRVQNTIARFKQVDPDMQRHFDTATGYAVFPSVTKGGAGVGGAFGRGALYQNGRLVGYCSLSQGTIGLQLGGQEYSEVIFFENRETLRDFKAGDFAFSAQASAVAAKEGASKTADYEDGVLVFTMTRTGLMFEASIGGQKFDFEPTTDR